MNDIKLLSNEVCLPPNLDLYILYWAINSVSLFSYEITFFLGLWEVHEYNIVRVWLCTSNFKIVRQRPVFVYSKRQFECYLCQGADRLLRKPFLNTTPGCEVINSIQCRNERYS